MSSGRLKGLTQAFIHSTFIEHYKSGAFSAAGVAAVQRRPDLMVGEHRK